MTIFRLRLRSGTQINDITASPALESRFTNFQTTNRKQFNESLQRHREHFMEEEKKQGLGETQRREEFEAWLKMIDQEFNDNLARCETLFKDAESAQERIFQTNEDSRQQTFKSAENRRDEAFKQNQETRIENAKWHAEMRETYLARGRRLREEAFRTLEREMEEQVPKLLQRFEDSFQSAERRRDETALKLAEMRSQSRDTRNSGTVSNRNHPPPFGYPGPIAISPKPVLPVSSTRPVRPPSIRRPYSPRSAIFPSPRRRRSLSPIPRSSPRPQPHRPRSHSSSKRNGSRLHRKNVLRRLLGGSGIQDPARLKIRQYSLDKRLGNFLNNLQESFQEEELSRNTRFSEAEARRNAAESERDSMLDERQREHGDLFDDMVISHKNTFENKEADRNAKEDWRTQQSELTETTRNEILKFLLLREESKFMAADKYEDDLLESTKSSLKTLERKQRQAFEEAKEYRLARFRAAQVRRSAELSIISTEAVLFEAMESSPPLMRTPLPTGSPSVRSSSPRYSALACRASRADSRPSPLTRVRRRVRERSPVTGFGAQLLLKGPQLFDDLPISTMIDTKELPSQGLSDTTTWQILFDGSQAQREEIFQTGMQKRQREFAVNEARREAEFERAHAERRELVRQAQSERAREFFGAQTSRGDKFHTSEKRREDNFRIEERERIAQFHEGESKREKEFASREEALQRRCADKERLRQEDCNEVVATLLPNRAKELLDEYKYEEVVRDQIFAKFIETSTSRRTKK